MSLKVGILTFHRSSNYGALLQTLGTYETLKEMECKPSVINYDSPNKRKNFLNILKNSSLKNKILYFSSFYINHKKKKYSNLFRVEQLNINSPIMDTKEDLEKYAKKLDKVIVGSDQVWNEKNTKLDKRFFLDFIKEHEKKIAYAASFGNSNNITDKFSIEVEPLLNQFAYISVRENDAVNVVENLIRKKPDLVLDPTLLLGKQRWEEIVRANMPVNKKRKPYVLVYSVGNRNNSVKFAKKLAKKHNLEVIVIGSDIRDVFSNTKVVIPSVIEYVKMFLDARYIVTSSFHGTAFSVNLNKEFFVTLNNKRGGLNSRQISLLDSLDLTDRLFFDEENNFENVRDIEWKDVNNKLDNLREKSKAFLRRSILEKDN